MRPNPSTIVLQLDTLTPVELTQAYRNCGGPVGPTVHHIRDVERVVRTEAGVEGVEDFVEYTVSWSKDSTSMSRLLVWFDPNDLMIKALT